MNPDLLRRDLKTAVQSSMGWSMDLHPGPAVDAVLAYLRQHDLLKETTDE